MFMSFWNNYHDLFSIMATISDSVTMLRRPLEVGGAPHTHTYTCADAQTRLTKEALTLLIQA